MRAFIYERYRNQLIADSDRNAVEAVIALTPPLHQVGERVRRGRLRANARSRQPGRRQQAHRQPAQEGRGRDRPGERRRAGRARRKALAASVATLRPQAEAQFATGDFAASLRTLAQAREPVDAFFADVMVMAEDPAVRANRLALLGQLHGLMNQVADISRLAQ